MSNLHTPQRLEDESFKEYQERRKKSKQEVKRVLKGTPVWNCLTQGTYRKSKEVK